MINSFSTIRQRLTPLLGSPTIPRRTAPFQGIRILLLCGIISIHCGEYILGGRELCTFFFVLSGFFFTPKKISYKQYLKSRFFKIFPLYWTVFLIASFSLDFQWEPRIIPHLLLLQSFPPSTDYYYFQYVGVAWFISSLFFCYICAPFLFSLIQRISKKCTIITILVLLILTYGYLSLPFPNEYHEYPIYVCPLYCLTEYSFGLLLNHLIKDIPEKHFECELIIEITIILLFALFLGIMHKGIFDQYSIHIPLLVISLLYLFPTRSMSWLLGNPLCLWLSQYIIHIYLIHQVIIFSFSEISGLKGFVISFSLGLLFGIIYSCCERGFLLFQKKSNRS